MKKFFLTALFIALTATGLFAPVSINIDKKEISSDIHVAYANHEPGHAANAAPTGGGSTQTQGGGGGSTNSSGWIDWKWAFGEFGNLILSVCGSILWIAGVLFNAAVQLSVVSMGAIVKDMPTIGAAWAVVRDIANIAFIFILLAIGIGTILGVQHYGIRPLLPRLIIVALLINFSLFFAQISIDVANAASFLFYKQLNVASGCPEATGPFDFSRCSTGGISGLVMDSLKLPTIYKYRSGSTAQFNATYEDERAVQNANKLDGLQILQIAVLGSILILIAAFVFFVAGILLLIRFGLLLLLMALAPAALAAAILPQTQKYWDQWLKTFIGQAFFAPVYMLLLYITFLILGTGEGSFVNKIAGNVEGMSFADAFSKGAQGQVVIFLAYGVVIVFMIGSLMIARTMATQGGLAGMKWTKGIRDWAAAQPGKIPRWAVARSSEKLSRAYEDAQARFEKTKVGRAAAYLYDTPVRSTLKAGQNVKFGTGKTYAESKKQWDDRRRELGERRDVLEKRDKLYEGAEAPSGSDEMKEAQKIVREMSEKQLEQVKAHVLKIEDLALQLSVQKLEAIQKSDKFSHQDKKDIKEAWKSALMHNPQETLKKSSGELAKLPAEVLTDALIAPFLRVSDLRAIVQEKSMSPENKDKIRAAIEGAHKTTPNTDPNWKKFDATVKWLNTQGQEF